MGGYDPRFVRAQDWELNHRIREAGGLVWFSPRLRVAYRPRPTLRALARQYRDYGRWRRVVARDAPRHHQRCATSPRRPPWCGVVGWHRRRVSVWPRRGCVPARLPLADHRGRARDESGLELRASGCCVPVVLPTMHLSWGWGFLTSRVRLDAAGA